MKWSMVITGGAMQFNLTPENEHEKEAFAILRKFNGPASIHDGVSVDECMGGYLRSFGSDDKTLAITIKKIPPLPGEES